MIQYTRPPFSLPWVRVPKQLACLPSQNPVLSLLQEDWLARSLPALLGTRTQTTRESPERAPPATRECINGVRSRSCAILRVKKDDLDDAEVLLWPLKSTWMRTQPSG